MADTDLPPTTTETAEAADADGGVTWRRMSPRFIVIGTLRQLRSLVIPAAIILLTGNMGEGRSNLIYIGIALVVTVLAALGSLVDWWNYRYALTDGELVVRSGIVQKQERVVPYGRIQAINVEEAPLERMVGIVRMKVETAAGGTADVDIRAVPREDAPHLREALAAARARARQADGAEPPAAGAATASEPDAGDAASVATGGELLRRLSTAELLALGATSGRIGPMAAVVGAVLQFGAELMPESWWDRIPWQEAEALRSVSVIASLLLAVAALTWLLAIGSTALTFGGFELRREGDQLLVQHGLLDRRRRTIPIARVQAIVVGQSPLRQPFRRADIRFESAGGAVDGAQADSGVLFPYLPLDEVEDLLRRSVPELAADPTTPMTTRLPRRALRRYVTGATIGWVVLVAVVAWQLKFWDVETVTWRQALLGLLAAPALMGLGWARWRDGGWHVDGATLLLRWRGVSRQTLITRPSRIQRRGLTADPFQRRAALATMQMAVASGMSGGHYALPHADRADAERLLARLGGPRHEVILRKVPAPVTP